MTHGLPLHLTTLAAVFLAAGCSSSNSGAPGADGGSRDVTTTADGSGSKSGMVTEAGLDAGSDASSQTKCPPVGCDAGCSNGIVYECLVLSPPPGGCVGAQPAMEFCPFGCTPQAPSSCNFNPVDGGVASGCVASSVTGLSGTIGGGDAGTVVAVTVFNTAGDRVIIATGAAAACAVEGDAGLSADAGVASVLILPTPSNFGGMAPATGAQRITWANGVPTTEVATAGTVTIGLDQPGGGKMGRYDVTFGTSVEQGTFVAPACDFCTWGM
jgi:hypothetical protein